ncbi:MAG: APC family permease [Pseudomonadales bacterium]
MTEQVSVSGGGAGVAEGSGQEGGLKRAISWQGAFWVAAGVPALVLFSIGGIAATVGVPSWLVWTISVCFGFLQAFTYAEIAGLFPNKSGGASVYGATAWLKYGKMIAPISVWCNWLAWSPVLAIGVGIAAGYILTALFPADAAIVTWQITLLDLSGLKEGLTLRIDSTFVLGATILVIVFFAQHHGISRLAKIQTIMAIATLVPLLLIGVVPLVTGDVIAANFSPFAPIAYGADGNIIMDSTKWAWDIDGWTLFLGGMFIAAWSTYAFETAICYTSEFKNPATDTFKAIFFAGLLCIFAYTVIPLSFQGSLGVEGMLEPGIVDGSGVAAAMAHMIGGGAFVGNIVVIMLIFALILAVMTSMAGSSRTLYQGAADGWLPKYLSHVNHHGAPTRAMWTDLGFNLILLLMSDYLFVLAVSNCCYIVFNFLNLNSGWIHRMDNGHVKRPWRAPTWILAVGFVLSFVNLVFMGAGANVWGAGTLMTGIVVISLIIPVFLFRHYVQDKGVFPANMLADIEIDGEIPGKKAGVLPYIVLIVGVAVVWASNSYFG